MGKMNMGRVLLGGLVAGLVLNVSEAVLHAGVLAADGAKLVEEWGRLGLKVEMRPSLLVWLIGITFVLGILAVWTYAAIRPRYGAGPKTALCAGLAVWAMSPLRRNTPRRDVVVPPGDLASRGLNLSRCRRDSLGPGSTGSSAVRA
jgi:hypothetical protein